MYTCIHTYMYIYIYIYVYVYLERERERFAGRGSRFRALGPNARRRGANSGSSTYGRFSKVLCVYIYIYIYIYIYTHMYIYIYIYMHTHIMVSSFLQTLGLRVLACIHSLRETMDVLWLNTSLSVSGFGIRNPQTEVL